MIDAETLALKKVSNAVAKYFFPVVYHSDLLQLLSVYYLDVISKSSMTIKAARTGGSGGCSPSCPSERGAKG